jgi:hypothetical protein
VAAKLAADFVEECVASSVIGFVTPFRISMRVEGRVPSLRDSFSS